MSITRWDLGPLTTAFQPKPSCTVPNVYDFSSSLVGIYWGVGCNSANWGNSDCFPAPLTSSYSTAILSTALPVFSPGYFCPSGWTTAGSWTRTDKAAPSKGGAEGRLLGLLEVGEVDHACCPRGYRLHSSSYHVCITQPAATELIEATSFTTGCSTLPSTITMAEETRSVLGYVPPIHLVKKFTDTAQETTSLTSVSSTESSSTSSITSMPPLPTITDGVNMPTTEDSGSGLSTGAKIGIGVAVPLGALIAGAILFFIYTRRRRRAKGEDGMGSQAAALPLKYGSPEDLEDSSHYMPAAVELVGSQKPMSELPAQPREERIVHELPADNNPYPSK